MHRLNVYLVSIMCLVALAVSTARAGPLSPADAMLVLDSPASAAQAMAAPSAPVRCTPGKSVGVWVDGATPLTVQGLTVDQCAVGVVVQGQGHTVRQMRLMSIPVVGVLWYGNGGEMTDNIMMDDTGEIYAQFSMVLMGSGVLVARNSFGSTTHDALLVTGDGNTIEDNLIRHAGRHGLNIVASVPVNGPTGAMLVFPRRAAYGNSIRRNDVQGSGRFDLRQWPIKCLDHEGNPADLANTYEANIYTTKSAWCLQ